MKGQVISGEYGKLVAREKSDQKLELGELVVADTKEGKILLQVFDLLFGSQISQQNLEPGFHSKTCSRPRKTLQRTLVCLIVHSRNIFKVGHFPKGKLKTSSMNSLGLNCLNQRVQRRSPR